MKKRIRPADIVVKRKTDAKRKKDMIARLVQENKLGNKERAVLQTLDMKALSFLYDIRRHMRSLTDLPTVKKMIREGKGDMNIYLNKIRKLPIDKGVLRDFEGYILDDMVKRGVPKEEASKIIKENEAFIIKTGYEPRKCSPNFGELFTRIYKSEKEKRSKK